MTLFMVWKLLLVDVDGGSASVDGGGDVYNFGRGYFQPRHGNCSYLPSPAANWGPRLGNFKFGDVL